MRNELNLWVAGGDMRQAKLAELLAADGHTVHAYALERLGALDRAACSTRPCPGGSTPWPWCWTLCGRGR